MKIVCIFDKLHHKSRNNGEYKLRFVSHLIHAPMAATHSQSDHYPIQSTELSHGMSCVCGCTPATTPQPFLIIQIFLSSSILIMLWCVWNAYGIIFIYVRKEVNMRMDMNWQYSNSVLICKSLGSRLVA